MGNCVVTVDTGGYSAGDVNKGWEVRGTIHLSATYAAGGDSFTAAQFGLDRLVKLMVEPAAGLTFTPDLANSKLRAYSAPATEVTGDQSAAVADYVAWGP